MEDLTRRVFVKAAAAGALVASLPTAVIASISKVLTRTATRPPILNPPPVLLSALRHTFLEDVRVFGFFGRDRDDFSGFQETCREKGSALGIADRTLAEALTASFPDDDVNVILWKYDPSPMTQHLTRLCAGPKTRWTPDKQSILQYAERIANAKTVFCSDVERPDTLPLVRTHNDQLIYPVPYAVLCGQAWKRLVLTLPVKLGLDPVEYEKHSASQYAANLLSCSAHSGAPLGLILGCFMRGYDGNGIPVHYRCAGELAYAIGPRREELLRWEREWMETHSHTEVNMCCLKG